MNSKLLKKTLLPLFLLFIAIITSIFMNYREKGVFLRISRNLPIYCVDTKDKKIAISFDVSWGKDNTEKILDILDKYNIKATFFF